MEPATTGFFLLRLAAFALGLFIVIRTLEASIKTFILPRGTNVWLTRLLLGRGRQVFQLRARRARTYEERDSIMALFAPTALLLMPVIVLVMILVGYMLLYWALEPQPVTEAMKLSGSSLLTLGYASVDRTEFKLLEFSEAMLGLILVALLIAYLPTMYSAFARRESAVALLETRAGSPPSAEEMIARSHRNDELDQLQSVWEAWHAWFAELEESHTSLAPLSFFRSPTPDRSWVTAAGTVLDAAALMLSTINIPWEPRAAFCIRGGYLALNNIANFFNVSEDVDTRPGEPISIHRTEFDAVCERLSAQGVPIKPDREQAWRDFEGWRRNYDRVLLSLSALTMAPFATWSSDRSAIRKPKGPRPEPKGDS